MSDGSLSIKSWNEANEVHLKLLDLCSSPVLSSTLFSSTSHSFITLLRLKQLHPDDYTNQPAPASVGVRHDHSRFQHSRNAK
ncbi:hypothetical protein PILCRDRAFT_10940 [Piloderma croceum F 1598]|uniref:Uncharacterized protein n=1 Tax=Piloderma croceum (strain F 1598) TaxID=765440 RepID=A0A0C3AXH9_PILCF|nr:hypothetical protein PILCRDRAFT_10940 [Piloderma croceum F 1598]